MWLPAIFRPRAVANGGFAVLARPELLLAAWRKVRSNGGGAGGDGVTIAVFLRDAARRLERLRDDLASGRYRPGPLRRIAIAKPSGGLRHLAIPCLADRIAQTAMLLILAPELDRRMADESFAYRPGRSVAHALGLARRFIAGGLTVIVDADIERFFDAVPHAPLVNELAIWLDDPRLLALSALWLKSFAPSGVGLPQGAPLSPLFANLYLHPFDRILAAAGIAAVRYADDFLLFLADHHSAERALAIAAGALRSRGLSLNPAKTRIVHAAEDVVFLGEQLCRANAALPPPRASRGAGQSTVKRRA